MPRASRTTAARGYDSKHQAERERWLPIVEAGDATCWRCQQPIDPAARWDLGHDDHNRNHYRGPEHEHCNRSAGAIAGNRLRGMARRRRPRVRESWPL